MAEKVVQYYPNASMVFVKGFQSRNDIEEIRASNIGDVQEIKEISTTITVRNSPGTFSATIVDTAGKFLDYDDMESEIAALFKASNGRRKISSKTNATESVYHDQAVGNYYGYSDFKTWREHTNYALYMASGDQIPIHSKVDNGTIVSMWAYDSNGNFIDIPNVSDITDNDEFEYGGYKYSIIRHKNDEFVSKYKDIDIQGDEEGKYLQGRCKIKSMDRVTIFMTERFPTTSKDPETYDQIRVFTGVVNSVQVGYSEGNAIITVQGEDVTKFLKISIVNVNPALLLDRTTSAMQVSTDNITIWTTILKGKNAIEIIKLMLLGSKISGVTTDNKQVIDGVGVYTVSSTTARGKDIGIDNNGAFIRSVSSEKSKDGISGKISIRDALGSLFTKNSIHIVDPYASGSKASGWRAYEVSIANSWSFYQSEFKTRREICDRTAEDTNFVFFADRFGEIWFRPPRFDNNWILGASNPDIYVADTQSIISYGFIDTDEMVYSSVYVTTEAELGLSGVEQLGYYTGSFRDDGIVLKYGQRIFTASTPLINMKTSDEKASGSERALVMYAKSLLQRLLSGRYQGQVVLTGRAELDPGRPIYVPAMNMIYYVETVDHSFQFGGTFTTTLSLSYGRKPYEFIPELLEYSANDDIYSTDGYLFNDMFEDKREDIPDNLKVNRKVKYEGAVVSGYANIKPPDDYFERMKEFDPIILFEANKNSVDANLIRAIIMQESEVYADAISDPYTRKATGDTLLYDKGLMQLSPGTAVELGVTDPFDPGQNIAGGTKYIGEQLRRFYKTDIALAAYNWGPANVTTRGVSNAPVITKIYVRNVMGYYQYMRDGS